MSAFSTLRLFIFIPEINCIFPDTSKYY